MRLIDADELGASVIKNTVFDKGDVIKLIEDAPSIEIITCRECKYYEAKEDWCYWRDEAITADDFCSYGKVSEIPTGSERSSE